ncbi:uncharacterized protein CELE_R09F10.9 [Caenorhabditis elegans]|uniref:Secreted protein n=1 Tax=Caenorhabditis elegans TaxID=6239 RepID=Q9TY06_CAEEL|nr:Secreted protein [Caenorhabditis elegans]CCD69421.1 Secreted protein [Caenorhabditis elegans]|eukprot:NP_509402.1 Uncharacterized protein CELE_R09F10.9 [Caenorhabditis elegans]
MMSYKRDGYFSIVSSCLIFCLHFLPLLSIRTKLSSLFITSLANNACNSNTVEYNIGRKLTVMCDEFDSELMSYKEEKSFVKFLGSGFKTYASIVRRVF